MAKAKGQSKEQLTLAAISDLRFPTKSRQYLMDLVAGIVRAHKAGFVLILGSTVDGRALESTYREQVKQEKALFKAREQEARAAHKAGQMELQHEAKARGEKYTPEPFDPASYLLDEEGFLGKFVTANAYDLAAFLPEIRGVNYHIVIAQKVFDRPIGVRILEHLREIRPDIRLVGEREPGVYDPEVKIPIRMRNFPVIRAIVPYRHPWFYRIITSFMQRLINSFVARTFSEEPSLILVGCTGTQAYLPRYKGVPSISVPALHKIDEQLSTENMVGCVVVKIITQSDGRTRLIQRAYDFRPLISRERELIIPQDASPEEKAVLQAFKSHFSSASFKTLLYHLTGGRPQEGSDGELRGVLQRLQEQQLIVYRPRSNRYAINEKKIAGVRVSLKELLQGTRTTKLAVRSCVHVGALKTLYHTTLNYFPKRAYPYDAIVENGDVIQGLAHNFEYNGEIIPIANTVDKHEILAAHIVAKNLLDIFRRRLARLKGKEIPAEELVRRCLIKYVFEKGNHPAWHYYLKHGLPLYLFETELKRLLTSKIHAICERHRILVSHSVVEKLVAEHVIRVGESNIVSLEGVAIGVKHPSKPRTLSKSHRIQDATEYLRLTSKDYGKDAKHLAVVLVANFHESAAVHTVEFNETVLGVMTGAQLKDTRFEASRDKVVEHGFALVAVCLNQEGRLVYSEVEYDDFIDPKDAEFVLADEITTSAVNKLCAELTQLVDLPWRL